MPGPEQLAREHAGVEPFLGRATVRPIEADAIEHAAAPAGAVIDLLHEAAPHARRPSGTAAFERGGEARRHGMRIERLGEPRQLGVVEQAERVPGGHGHAPTALGAPPIAASSAWIARSSR